MEPAKNGGAAGVDANQTGPQRLRGSAWGVAMAERDQREEAGANQSALSAASGAMREAFKLSVTEFCDAARAAEAAVMEAGLVERERSKLKGVASVMIGEQWSKAVRELANARQALGGLVREATSEGLLDECRQWMVGELKNGVPEVDCLTRALAQGALQRALVAERLGAQGSHAELARWAGDDEFWRRLGWACAEPSAYDNAEALWSKGFKARSGRDWAQTVTKAMELAMRGEEARGVALKLLVRLERALRFGEGDFSFRDFGQTGDLPATSGVDPEQARKTVAATPMHYWQSAREKILCLDAPDENQRMLSDGILETMIEKASKSYAEGTELGKHLWLNLDLDGLERWEAIGSSTALRVIGELGPDLSDTRAHIRLAYALKQPKASWARPAFEMAGLSLENGAWGGEGFVARAKTAFEGVYALLQARELKAQTQVSRAPAAKKAGASL